MTPTQRKAMQDAMDALTKSVKFCNHMGTGDWQPTAMACHGGIAALKSALAAPAPEPVAWNGLTDVQWMNIVNKNSAWLGYSVEDAVHEVVRLTEARLKANNAAPVLGAAPKPVASIYITPDGQREVDDWKVTLPVGSNELYAAPVREPAPECQYAKDIGMPEHRCAAKCQYESAPVPLLTDAEISDIAIANPPNVHTYGRAIEKAVRQKAGL